MMTFNRRREAASRVTRSAKFLHAGSMGDEIEAAAIGFDEGLALAAHDLLAGLVAARASGLVRFDALAIDDAGARLRRTTLAFAIDHQQRMVERLEHSAVPPGRKSAINRSLRWMVAWQESLSDTAAHNAENRAEDIAQRPGRRPTRPLRR